MLRMRDCSRQSRRLVQTCPTFPLPFGVVRSEVSAPEQDRPAVQCLDCLLHFTVRRRITPAERDDPRDKRGCFRLRKACSIAQQPFRGLQVRKAADCRLDGRNRGRALHREGNGRNLDQMNLLERATRLVLVYAAHKILSLIAHRQTIERIFFHRSVNSLSRFRIKGDQPALYRQAARILAYRRPLADWQEVFRLCALAHAIDRVKQSTSRFENRGRILLSGALSNRSQGRAIDLSGLAERVTVAGLRPVRRALRWTCWHPAPAA